MKKRLAPVLVLTLGLALLVSACGGGKKRTSDMLIWGVGSDPVSLDGALAPDPDSRRVIAQVFEGLVTLNPGTTEVVPSLAQTWTPADGGRSWTFHLRSGVHFQDGTQFDAAAVCFNFERWHGFVGPQRDLSTSYYWQRVFGGFVGQPSLYAGCRAQTRETVVIRLARPSASFLAALAMPAFSFESPAAIQRGRAVGTGPFRVESWNRGDSIVLARNNSYWGAKPILSKIVFRVLADPAARLAALERGEIDGYDFVDSKDLTRIEGNSDLQLLDRPAFDLGYLTINSARGPFSDARVRRAVAYGLDRNALAHSFARGRASVADEFVPPELFGYAPDVVRYPFDPAKAKALLRASGLSLPVPLELWYPTGVSRPYLPDPQRAARIFSRSLERSGFRVTLRYAPWDGGYLTSVDQGRAGDINLVGWTGDYGDPDNFLGVFFGHPTTQFGFQDRSLFDLLDRASSETRRAERARLYQEANRRIMSLLPGVPLVHSREALALRANVQGYISSPVLLESFADVSLAS